MCLLFSPLSAPVVGGLAQEEGNPWWLWIVVLAILAAFAAFVLWWWLRSPEEESPGPPARSVPPALVPGPGAAVSPEIAGTPELSREAEPQPLALEAEVPRVEDLEIVEGIGPKIAAVLRGSGINTFAQLALLDAERLRQILRDRNPNLLRLADPATWPEQARLAAEGEWEALAAFQQELKGGRRA